MFKGLRNRLHRKFMHFRLQPIRVFCFHHVSKVFDPMTMWKEDWTQLDSLKEMLLRQRNEGVEFISLPLAHEKLKHDWFRRKKYAVLTADDGYKSVLSIIPWLTEENIPITLFINTHYLDGKSWSDSNSELAQGIITNRGAKSGDEKLNIYLSEEELHQLSQNPMVTLGMHGHEHTDFVRSTEEEFVKDVTTCQDLLSAYKHSIPYFAYPWGHNNAWLDEQLRKLGIVPVLINKALNYDNTNYINRTAVEEHYK